MSPAAPANTRRTVIRFAIGVDLVVIAVATALLLPAHYGVILPLFIAAVAMATWRGGWKVGLTTTALSIVALAIVFDDTIMIADLILFAVAGIAVPAFLGPARLIRFKRTEAPSAAALQKAAEDELSHVRAAADSSERRRQRVLPFVMYLVLPAFVLLVYLNLSSILVENFSIPSVLQLFLLVLAIPIIRYHDAFRPATVVLRPLTIALIGYILVVFTSSNWARDVSVSDKELSDLLKSLMLLIVAASIAATWRALRLALIALVIGAVLLSVLALVQVVVGNPDLRFGGLADLESGHIYGEVSDLRPAGPLGDPNYFARMLVIAFPAAAFLGLGRQSRKERAAYLVAAALIALGILFTYSRGGMLALGTVAVLLVMTHRLRVTRVNILIGVVVLMALLPTNVGQRIFTIEELISSGSGERAQDASSDKRKQLLAVGWRMFSEHPLFGVGVGNFGSNYAAYANEVGMTSLDFTPAGLRQYAHNLYLETAAETGLLGLFAFIGAMAVAMVTMNRARQVLLQRGQTEHAALVTAVGIALAGYLVASLFLHHSGVHRYMWLVLGFAVAALRLTDDGVREERAVA